MFSSRPETEADRSRHLRDAVELPDPLPGHQVTRVPFGPGIPKPPLLADMVHVAAANHQHARYAWAIVSRGVCNRCGFGVGGLYDGHTDGVHTCMKRLEGLEMATMEAMDPHHLSNAAALRRLSDEQLLRLGRLSTPAILRHGATGFDVVSWDVALEAAAVPVRELCDPASELAFYSNANVPQETAFVLGKAARLLGATSFPNGADLCHASSTTAMKESLGVGASTCSFIDWKCTEWLIFIGCNPANTSPVTAKLMEQAKDSGVRIASVNPVLEPGMKSYFVPSSPKSLLFGTKIADVHYPVLPGGDAAFLTGVMKALVEEGREDREFLSAHTTGFPEFRSLLESEDWELLERESGLTRRAMRHLAGILGEARRAILVWSMGLSQHELGVGTVQLLMNLALMRGFIGREGCGVTPLRGQMSVQSLNQVSRTELDPDALEAVWGFPIPRRPSMNTVEMLDSAAQGRLKALVNVGGDFTKTLPDRDRTERALAGLHRVHVDVALSRQALIDPVHGRITVLLPAETPFKLREGFTAMATDRKVRFSPFIPGGPDVPLAQHDYRILIDLAIRVDPGAEPYLRYSGTREVRDDMERVCPSLKGVAELSERNSVIQPGGRILCRDGHFPTTDGRARIVPVRVEAVRPPEGWFHVVNRRGSHRWNSREPGDRDSMTGVALDSALFNPEDAAGLGVRSGDCVRLENEHGACDLTVEVKEYVRPDTIAVFWNDLTNRLNPADRRSRAGVPGYKDTLARVLRQSVHTVEQPQVREASVAHR